LREAKQHIPPELSAYLRGGPSSNYGNSYGPPGSGGNSGRFPPAAVAPVGPGPGYAGGDVRSGGGGGYPPSRGEYPPRGDYPPPSHGGGGYNQRDVRY